MAVLFSRLLLTVLLVSCFASFSWAVRNFFVKEERVTMGIRLTLLTGTVFVALHLAVILFWSTLRTSTVLIGVGLYVASFVIFWSAIAANRVKPLAACFSIQEELHLVQHGPYRFVRHPFYCSYLLAWIAGAVATRSLVLAATVAVMLVLYWTAAVKEEKKFASSPLGASYARYRAATGRFFPKLFFI